MKIQITITRKDLKFIVCRHLGIVSEAVSLNDLTVVVVVDESEYVTDPWSKLKEWHDISPSRKIEAIKGIRSSYPGTDLSDAKCATESRWEVLYSYVTKNNTINGFYKYTNRLS